MGNLCCQNQERVQFRFENITYYVKSAPNSTIKQLKSNIEKQNHLPTKDILLFYKGTKINDTDTLETLGFSINHDTLVMQKEVRGNSQIILSIRSINFTEEVKINPILTVEDLKKIIEEKQNLPVRKQRLISSNVVLKDNEQLSFYGVKDGSTVYCAMSLVP